MLLDNANMKVSVHFYLTVQYATLKLKAHQQIAVLLYTAIWAQVTSKGSVTYAIEASTKGQMYRPPASLCLKYATVHLHSGSCLLSPLHAMGNFNGHLLNKQSEKQNLMCDVLQHCKEPRLDQLEG